MKSYLGVLLISFFLIVTAYSHTYRSPFVLDDMHSFVRNPVTHVQEFNHESFNQLKKTQFGTFRFLPMVTFAFDYWWGQGSVVAYHVTNNVIHVLCWLTCLWMLWCLMSTPRLAIVEREGKFFVAAAVAALWALNPVQTGAVTYLVQRMASLQALFFMAAVAAYVEGRLRLDHRRARAVLWWAMAALFSLGALLSKENSAMLPVVVALVEVAFFRPEWWQKFPARLWQGLRKPWGLLGILFIGAILFFVAHSLLDYCAKGYAIRHFTMKERVLTEARVVMRYLFAILVPHPGALSLEHDVELSRSFFTPPTTALSIATIGGLLTWAVWALPRQPLIGFGILWFFLNLVIESTVVPLELMFDHRMYLPSVGLILAAFEALRRLCSKCGLRWTVQERRKMAWSAVAVVCSVLTLITFIRNEDWESAININADAVRKAPHHPRAHANLAYALNRSGRYAEAIEAARRAVELGRDHFEEHIVASTAIVLAYVHLGDEAKALEEGERLLAMTPKAFDASALPNFLFIMAELQRKAGKYGEAFSSLQRALEVMAEFPRLRTDAAMIYSSMHRLLRDVAERQVDIDGDGMVDPGDIEPAAWLARKLYEMRDWDGAQIFAGLDPSSPVAQEVQRRIALAEDRNRTQAARWGYRKYLWRPTAFADMATGLAYWLQKQNFFKGFETIGLKLLHVAAMCRPYNPDVPLLQGWYAFEAGRVQEAVAKARQAVEMDPMSAKAWIALGFFEQKAGNLENSLAAFQQTLELYPGYPKRQVLEHLMAQLRTQIMAISLPKAPVRHAALEVNMGARP
ncbi:tetratricopeptide repeat protein [Desulfosoma caldarium]|uniref:Tetratricopeptide repeat protein n=1 Tax=Desulfosoma caldarium TaxID=610254 RepID=A0A3N1VNY4_9BACT|nr:tetratricopeptide repeat protein [Desulfosoma caldarium]